jgi:hypothetical protein
VSHLISAKLAHLISFAICSGAALWAIFIGGIIIEGLEKATREG